MGIGTVRPYVTAGLIFVIGMVMMTIGYYVFPSLLEGADSARTATNVSYYIALSPMIRIGPTLVLMGFTFGGLGTMFLSGAVAVRAYRKK